MESKESLKRAMSDAEKIESECKIKDAREEELDDTYNEGRDEVLTDLDELVVELWNERNEEARSSMEFYKNGDMKNYHLRQGGACGLYEARKKLVVIIEKHRRGK